MLRNITSLIHNEIVQLESKLSKDSIKSNFNSRLLLKSLLNAELVFGRIIWLIINEYLHHSDLQPLIQMKLATVFSSSLMTEYQLQSAFEIIDVNGDGLLTTEEVSEVFQVLALDNSNQKVVLTMKGLHDSLSTIFVPTQHWLQITYDELLLVCSSSIASSELVHLNLNKLFADLFSEKIYKAFIDYWLVCKKSDEVLLLDQMLAKELFSSMDHLLQSEYWMDKELVSNYKLSFQCGWGVYKDKHAEDGCISTCPVAITGTLYSYLIECAALFTHNWVSFDVFSTNNCNLMLSSGEYQVSSQSILACMALRMLGHIETTYASLNIKYNEITLICESKHSVKVLFERLLESIAIQVLFDILYVIQFTKDVKKNSAVLFMKDAVEILDDILLKLQNMLDMWVNRIDPVTYSLIHTEYLLPNMNKYYHSITALLSCFIGKNAHGEYSSTSSVTVFEDVFLTPMSGLNTLGTFGMLAIPISLATNIHSTSNNTLGNRTIADQTSNSSIPKGIIANATTDHSSMLSRAIGSLW